MKLSKRTLILTLAALLLPGLALAGAEAPEVAPAPADSPAAPAQIAPAEGACDPAQALSLPARAPGDETPEPDLFLPEASDTAAACRPCPIGSFTCDGYPYCWDGAYCCFPLKGVCNFICW